VPPSPIKQAAALRLHGSQESVFQELDSLLSQGGDRKQREYGSQLASELDRTLKTMRQGRHEAAEMAYCEDLKASLPRDQLSGKKLFAELDSVIQKRDPSETPLASRFDSFENEVKSLLQRVSSDSQLLHENFPVEVMQRREPSPPATPAGGSEANAQDMPSLQDLKANPFEELCPLLLEKSDLLEDHHRQHASRLAANMEHFLGGAQRRQQEAAEFADRFIRGEGSDGHPLDQEHAAWRRNTLQILQRGPTTTKWKQPPVRRGMGPGPHVHFARSQSTGSVRRS